MRVQLSDDEEAGHFAEKLLQINGGSHPTDCVTDRIELKMIYNIFDVRHCSLRWIPHTLVKLTVDCPDCCVLDVVNKSFARVPFLRVPVPYHQHFLTDWAYCRHYQLPPLFYHTPYSLYSIAPKNYVPRIPYFIAETAILVW
ncbi:hypothetical protein J437_LFUL014482 [Ladona fulva]|uniref:Uncharacterized protein n=1 Tax=Ladona fulva TaxID=123851 RepID=A0A8K0KLK8_LADFU|nr:hypothetical protein J437_LFUL014482 [Ladona fulva]